jgi:hypothetical protein
MDSNDWAIIKRHLENAICRTVQQFQQHPADFLSENDNQAVLFAELRNEMRDLRMKYEAACPKDRCFGKPLDVSRVMSEYWIAAEGQCDIVVLCGEQDPEAAALWRHPCRIGIEIKLWQALEPHNWNGPRGSQKDVEKLQRYWKHRDEKGQPFTGIAMLFRRPGAFPCQEVVQMAGTDHEAAYPENGVAIHVISKDNHWCNTAAVLKLTAVTAQNTD